MNPPLDPASIEANLRSRNLSDRVPLLQRYWIWLKGIVLHWDWGQAPKGGEVGAEVSRRIWVSVRLITLGSLLGTVIGVMLGAWTATRAVQVLRPECHRRLVVHLVRSLVRHRQRAPGVRDQVQQRHRDQAFRVRRRDRRPGQLLRRGPGRQNPAPHPPDDRPDPHQRCVLQPDPAQPHAGRLGLGLRPHRARQGASPVQSRR